MSGRLFIGFWLTLLASCASHDYRIDGDEMTLRLATPWARRVVFFCSLDGFTPRPAEKIGGRWQVRLPPDRAFRYFYRIDDRLFVPDCRRKERDDFGSENCIFDPDL